MYWKLTFGILLLVSFATNTLSKSAKVKPKKGHKKDATLQVMPAHSNPYYKDPAAAARALYGQVVEQTTNDIGAAIDNAVKDVSVNNIDSAAGSQKAKEHKRDNPSSKEYKEKRKHQKILQVQRKKMKNYQEKQEKLIQDKQNQQQQTKQQQKQQQKQQLIQQQMLKKQHEQLVQQQQKIQRQQQQHQLQQKAKQLKKQKLNQRKKKQQQLKNKKGSKRINNKVKNSMLNKFYDQKYNDESDNDESIYEDDDGKEKKDDSTKKTEMENGGDQEVSNSMNTVLNQIKTSENQNKKPLVDLNGSDDVIEHSNAEGIAPQPEETTNSSPEDTVEQQQGDDPQAAQNLPDVPVAADQANNDDKTGENSNATPPPNTTPQANPSPTTAPVASSTRAVESSTSAVTSSTSASSTNAAVTVVSTPPPKQAAPPPPSPSPSSDPPIEAKDDDDTDDGGDQQDLKLLLDESINNLVKANAAVETLLKATDKKLHPLPFPCDSCQLYCLPGCEMTCCPKRRKRVKIKPQKHFGPAPTMPAILAKSWRNQLPVQCCSKNALSYPCNVQNCPLQVCLPCANENNIQPCYPNMSCYGG